VAHLERSRESFGRSVHVTTFERQLTPDWLGMPGKPGKFANVLKSTADFLVAQKSIRAAPGIEAFQKAINTTFMAKAVKA